MNGFEPKSVNREIDLGVTTTINLKPTQQCSEVQEVNKLFAFIGRAFEYNIKHSIFTLHNSLIRPPVECWAHVLYPYYQKYIAKLEQVQHRVTKLILSLKSKLFEGRLRSKSISVNT